MSMVWDTGSEWSVIQGYTCDSCHLTYDYSGQVGNSFTVVDSKLTSINYGSAKTKGFKAMDTICLQRNPSTCVNNESIFVVTEQRGFEKTFHGIQGLSTEDTIERPNFIKSL